MEFCEEDVEYLRYFKVALVSCDKAPFLPLTREFTGVIFSLE